ncbi:hypothetical protein CEK25_012184 [Fusarium fujikuroi]|nr:hypothetical protein CEK25_012184 [Fusarium fujikuroi]
MRLLSFTFVNRHVAKLQPSPGNHTPNMPAMRAPGSSLCIASVAKMHPTIDGYDIENIQAAQVLNLGLYYLPLSLQCVLIGQNKFIPRRLAAPQLKHASLIICVFRKVIYYKLGEVSIKTNDGQSTWIPTWAGWSSLLTSTWNTQDEVRILYSMVLKQQELVRQLDEVSLSIAIIWRSCFDCWLTNFTQVEEQLRR